MSKKRAVFTKLCREKAEKYGLSRRLNNIIKRALTHLEKDRYGSYTIRPGSNFRLLSYVYKYRDVQWLVGLNVVKHDEMFRGAKTDASPVAGQIRARTGGCRKKAHTGV